MTPEERLKFLSPSHDHFEQVDDPWHVDAFAGCDPAVQQAIQEGRIVNLGRSPVAIQRGVRRRVWYSVDWCGNLIGEWGEDKPPGAP